VSPLATASPVNEAGASTNPKHGNRAKWTFCPVKRTVGRAMQNAGGVAVDVPSELADLRAMPLHEIPAGAPVAVDIAVQRVLLMPAGAAGSVHGGSFSSCI
jgi:hypothetical protein